MAWHKQPKSIRIRSKLYKLIRNYYKEIQKQKKPHNKIDYAGVYHDEDELLNAMDAVLSVPNWAYGRYCKQFEKEISAYLGCTHTVFVNSGSSANLLAFMALTSPELGDRRILPGNEIITTALCFPTTIAPIIQYGAVPVFVDVNDTLNIDVNKLENAISEDTKAVIIAHTLGNPADIELIKNICKKNNLWLIEDNCDGLGSEYENQKTGVFGDISTLSFYPAHHITTGGEGGAVCTSNAKLYNIIKSLSAWGRDCTCDAGEDNKCHQRFTKKYHKLPKGYDHKYVYSHLGYNLKGTEIQAAIGLAQIKKINEIIFNRKFYYYDLLDYLNSRYNKFINFQKQYFCSEISPFGLYIEVTKNCPLSRNDIVQLLEANGIQTRPVFSGNITLHPCFKNLKNGLDYYILDKLKRTNEVVKNGFWIGVWPGLTKENIEYIKKTFDRILKK